MNPEDLQGELDRLWQRVTHGSEPEASSFASFPPSPLSDAPSITREVSLEAIALLKRQHRGEILRMQQLLELKERSLRELSDRLTATEAQVASANRRSQNEEERIYQEVFSASVELENAQKAIKAQEARFREEEQVLRSIAEETRKHLAAETARWRDMERQFNEREQQYLLDLKELQNALARAQEQAGQHEAVARRSANDLKEAKTAIEKTLTELLQERRERENSDSERDKALTRLKELEEHMRDLQNIWEEERRQWQELWDRERSTWETQRQEFTSWEGKVRKERETWHAELKQIEERETRYATQMTELLRRTSDAGEKLAALMRFATPKNVLVAVGRLSWKRVAGGALALALASAYPLWRVLKVPRLEPLSAHALKADNPTALAFDGASLWLCDWDGTFAQLDAQDPALVLTRVKTQGPDLGVFHPVALAMTGDAFYTLDSAQGRIVKHDLASPGRVLEQWSSPGPAPVALAHDGRNLWSFDAVTRTLYRHLGEGRDSQTEPYVLELDALPTAMAWQGGTLWIYDSKGKRIVFLELRGNRLRKRGSRRLDQPVLSMTFAQAPGSAGREGLELWTLAVSSPESASPGIKKFVVR